MPEKQTQKIYIFYNFVWKLFEIYDTIVYYSNY